MASQDPLRLRAEPLDGSRTPGVARIAAKRNTVQTQSLESVCEEQKLRRRVGSTAPVPPRVPGPADLDTLLLRAKVVQGGGSSSFRRLGVPDYERVKPGSCLLSLNVLLESAHGRRKGGGHASPEVGIDQGKQVSGVPGSQRVESHLRAGERREVQSHAGNYRASPHPDAGLPTLV